MTSQHCNLLLRLLGGGDQCCARMRKLVPFDLVVVLVFFLGLIVSPFSMVAEGAHFRFVPRTARNLAENSDNHAVAAGYLAPPLEFGFYHKTCPQFPEIVKKVVTAEFELDPTSAGPQLRLFFHDCFVQGCDGSVLLNSTKVNQAEKDASNNFSLSNFFVIDEVKEQLEKECPGVVSCADVLALVAVYSVQAVRHCCAAAACILKKSMGFTRLASAVSFTVIPILQQIKTTNRARRLLLPPPCM
jgi:hypothetical protein